MFVLLVAASFVLYAPVVLLPLLREYANVCAEERRLGAEVKRLSDEVAHRKRLVEAFKSDPIVNERLAQLDLGYQRPGEEVVPVRRAAGRAAERDSGAAGEASDPNDEPLVADEWPIWAHEAESFARRWGLLRVYMNPAIRVVLLGMAGGLVIAAFVLYRPRDEEEAAV